MAEVRIWNPLPHGRGKHNQRGVILVAHRKYKVHRHHRRHRNPLGIDSASFTGAFFGLGGAVGTLAAPALVMSASNTGVVGYGMNFASALILKLLADSMVGKSQGDAVFTGGLVALGLRIARDQFPTAPGLGAYWPSYFALPTSSNPYGQTLQSPYPQPALPVAAGAGGGAGMSGGGRFRKSRFH